MRKFLPSPIPLRFLEVLKKIRAFFLLLSVLFLGFGLSYAFWGSPPDYQMGETVRIMYVHVPASWLALGLYALMALCAFGALLWRNIVAELSVKALAPIGTCFCLISLVTGSLWGKPMWGAWWVWDARLTSMLVLFFLYIGYQALVASFENRSAGLRSGHYLVLVGALNLPIIKWSVNWWTTLHQPASLLRAGKSTIHEAFLLPLFLMALSFIFISLYLFTLRFQLEIQRRRESVSSMLANNNIVKSKELNHVS